jgi:hypothetical protein
MGQSKLSVVSQTDIGLYVWEMPDGRIVADEDQNIMNIPARRGDLFAISKIVDAAKYYGLEEGKPLFIEGSRRITNEELQEQRQRMLDGLVPDPYDIGVYKDAIEDGFNQK